jgi:hypothetical protein
MWACASARANNAFNSSALSRAEAGVNAANNSISIAGGVAAATPDCSHVSRPCFCRSSGLEFALRFLRDGFSDALADPSDPIMWKPQPCEEAAKVVAGGGEHGVDGVAAGMGEVISAHAVVLLEVADDGARWRPAV